MRQLLALTLLTTGCSGPLAGEWFGTLSCGTIHFDFEMELARDGGKSYLGTGKQERNYTAVNGDDTHEIVEFDASLELRKAGGPQNLNGDLTCTFEQKVVTHLSGGEPEVLSEGCTPLRYNDYQYAWDGKDAIDVQGPDACSGTLDRL